MQKYIASKSVEGDKANNVKDLPGMGKAIWEFISIVYKSHWDALHIDDNNTFLKNKIKSQFAPQNKLPQALNKGKEVSKPTFVLSIPLPIPAKLPKEVKEISKFFKKIEKPVT